MSGRLKASLSEKTYINWTTRGNFNKLCGYVLESDRRRGHKTWQTWPIIAFEAKDIHNYSKDLPCPPGPPFICVLFYFEKEMSPPESCICTCMTKGELLKVRHSVRLKKKEKRNGWKSDQLDEANQTWHRKSPRTFIKNSKRGRVFFQLFLPFFYQLDGFILRRWFFFFFFTIWRKDNNLVTQ